MKNIFKKYQGKQKSFTLVELMIATGIFMVTFVGILMTFVKCLELSELSKNSILALYGSKSRLERIKNTQNIAFNQIKANYNNVLFTVNGLTGNGVTYVDDTNPNLLKVTVTFCWRQSNQRVIGEDKNLNGQLNAGEDANGNGLLDSPTTLVNYIFNAG